MQWKHPDLMWEKPRTSLTLSVDTRSVYRVEWEKPRISLTPSVDTGLCTGYRAGSRCTVRLLS